ncbi:hypothetical protein MO973_00705 [Paenibacillus sp. TRM 82003]|nr:hypothetical protein [Paenibacillus sp. TRM 82003]
MSVDSVFPTEAHHPLQFGFQYETESYRERTIDYGSLTVLYYQFRMKPLGTQIRVVPDGCVDILFRCDPTSPSAAVCGSVLQGVSIPFAACSEYFGIRLSPKQSLHLQRLPFRETIGRQIPLHDVSSALRYAPEALSERTAFEDRIACFERLALHCLFDENGGGLLDYCVDRIARSGGTLPVERLADETGYTASLTDSTISPIT